MKISAGRHKDSAVLQGMVSWILKEFKQDSLFTFI